MSCAPSGPGDPDAGTSDDGGRPGAEDAGPPDAGAPAQGPDAGPVDAGPPPAHADPTPAAIAYFADLDENLADAALVTALHDKLAGDHIELTFAGLFAAYETTDTGRAGCAGIFDFYSDQCWDPTEACGQYAVEGDCFNREHSWPKSWWGGSETADQHQDLIAVVPSDGFVNGVRANLPLGDVDFPDYGSTNGSVRGPCVAPGAPPESLCFQPAPSLRGDFARIYFYMAVRYEGELSCCDELAVDGADIKAWQESMMRTWHAIDPVDLDERERNERVFGLQGNRNPFVDFPALVDRIDDF
jgi:endonuclease I